MDAVIAGDIEPLTIMAATHLMLADTFAIELRISSSVLAYIIERTEAAMSTQHNTSLWMHSIEATFNRTDIGCHVRFALTPII